MNNKLKKKNSIDNNDGLLKSEIEMLKNLENKAKNKKNNKRKEFLETSDKKKEKNINLSHISNYNLNSNKKDKGKNFNLKKTDLKSKKNKRYNNSENPEDSNNLKIYKYLAMKKTFLLEKRKKSILIIQRIWKGYLIRRWFEENKLNEF